MFEQQRVEVMADRVGFEPTVRSHAHTLSKRAHSTTLTPVLLEFALWPRRAEATASTWEWQY